MMKNKEMERFINQELPEDIQAVRFDLRHKDVMLSAKLVGAACHEEWSAVEIFLKQGADPRVCRFSDGISCESALYFALKAKQFALAGKLYHAGDRLDDLRAGECDRLPAETLEFLSREAACGKDYFTETDKPLSECVRGLLFKQIREKMEHASRTELELSVEYIMLHLRKHNAEACLEILQDLQKHGADIAQYRSEFINVLKELRRYPAALRPDEHVLDNIAGLVKGA